MTLQSTWPPILSHPFSMLAHLCVNEAGRSTPAAFLGATFLASRTCLWLFSSALAEGARRFALPSNSSNTAVVTVYAFNFSQCRDIPSRSPGDPGLTAEPCHLEAQPEVPGLLPLHAHIVQMCTVFAV